MGSMKNEFIAFTRLGSRKYYKFRYFSHWLYCRSVQGTSTWVAASTTEVMAPTTERLEMVPRYVRCVTINQLLCRWLGRTA